MKVLKESTKEQKDLSLPRRSMRNPVANGVTVSQSAVSNNSMESKSRTKEQDLEEKVSPGSRQQSMRKSRTSGELERDVALSAVQSSAKLPTPLNPVTPLRWKSSKRVESEKRKLQEEIKTKEVVKEEKKNPKPAKEERKNQSKLTTASKLEVNGIETSNKAETPISNPATSQEEITRFTSSASTSKSMGETSINEKAGDLKISHPDKNLGSNEPGNEHAKHREEVSPANAKHETDQIAGDNSGADRKHLTGDESSAITIDFLRARLLAERASSKAAKERIQQLTRKVHELEGRLDQEIQSKRKAEEEAREALLKFESLGQCNVPRENEPLSLHEKTKTDKQDQELLVQAEEKCQVPADVDDTRPNATVDIKPGHTQSTSLEINDDNEQVASEAKSMPTPEQEIGGHHGVQSLKKIGFEQDVKHDDIPTVPTIVSTNGDSDSSANSELKRQEKRFSIEERLLHMWNQMAEEMATLAEDKTQEDRVREELLNWMRQVPSVVQNILPKRSEEKKLVTEIRTKNMQPKGGDVPTANLDLDQALNSKEETVEERSPDGASHGDSSTTHDKGLKKVASLIERFEANESIQREWEHSNAKQNSTGRRRSNEGSLSRTNSNPGTPQSIEPQQGHRHEVSADAPPKPLLQVEDPRHNSLATDSSVSPREGMSAESLLIRNENGKVGIDTPENRTPSTCPDSPIVGEMVSRSGGEGITPTRAHGTINPSLELAEFGLEGSMDASFITPPLLSLTSGPSAGENRGDIRSSPVDRPQLLKQSNQYLDPRAFEGNCKTPEGHSERSSGEIGEPARSQAFIGWVNLEEAHTPTVLTNRGDNSLQWDASIRGRHLEHERLGPYSQAGNSNAYIRPGNYPLRNDEREIYRGRMESVSRSMEGLGGSWRSLSDPEGDETQPYADIPDSIDSATTRRSGLQMPFQVNGGSGRSNYYQAENMEGMSQSFAYPGRELSRENFQSRSPSTRIESTTSKVNEVLKALQLAKLSIQNSGGRRTSISNPCYPTSEHSYPGGDKHNLKTHYGYNDGRMSNESPAAIRVQSHQEISRRYSTGNFRDAGSPSHLQPSNSSAPFGMLIEAPRKYPDDQ